MSDQTTNSTSEASDDSLSADAASKQAQAADAAGDTADDSSGLSDAPEVSDVSMLDAALGTSADLQEVAEPGAESAAEPAVDDTALRAAEQRVAELEADNTALQEAKQDHWNRLLRATADVENVRKRAKRDVDDARTEARSKVLREMLPVIDNLERALEHAESTGAMEDKEASAVVEGVRLVLRQFSQALERCEVKPIDAVGKPFDPNLHEAISQMETADHPPGAVAQALQKGYMIGDRLLRPALVVVAKAPSPPEPEATAATDTDDDTGDDTGETTDETADETAAGTTETAAVDLDEAGDKD